jgi:hypothetical protein
MALKTYKRNPLKPKKINWKTTRKGNRSLNRIDTGDVMCRNRTLTDMGFVLRK